MGEEEAPFVRKASGLVKAWSWVDGLIYNIMAVNLATWIFWSIGANSYVFPGADQAIAVLLTVLLFLPHVVVYAIFLCTMPRSGGDYIFQSRTLHPSVGYTIGFWYFITELYWTPLAGWAFADMVFSPFFYFVGYLTNNVGLQNLGIWFTTVEGIGFSIALMIIWTFIINYFGIKWYGRAQKIAFTITVVSLFVIFAMVATMSHESFLIRLNEFGRGLGYDNMYNYLKETAEGLGFGAGVATPFAFRWDQTFGAMAAMSLVLVYAVWSQFIGGEFKEAESFKRQTYMVAGALIIAGVLIAAQAFFFTTIVGKDVLGYSSFLFNEHPEAYPFSVPPYLTLFLTMGNPVLFVTLLCTVFLFFGGIMNYTNSIPAATRTWFSMSFDRMLPSSFTKVSEKYHSPTFGVAFATLIAIAYAVLWMIFPDELSSLLFSGAFKGVIAWSITAFAAIILPFRKSLKEVYERSPISRIKILGIPISVVAGTLAIIVWFYLGYVYLTSPELGLVSIPSLMFFGGLLLFSFVCYVIAYYYNKSRGIEVEWLYKQIPPA